ncbi:hypothetical protein ACJ73_01840, partial [Blastomyces percursus]
MGNRDSVTTGVSPFFMMHGYNVPPIEFEQEPIETTNPRSPLQQAENMIAKLKDAVQWAQASMAMAQQEQEKQANKHRNPAPQFKIGDK